MPEAGFETVIPTNERQHNYALNCAATGIDTLRLVGPVKCWMDCFVSNESI